MDEKASSIIDHLCVDEASEKFHRKREDDRAVFLRRDRVEGLQVSGVVFIIITIAWWEYDYDTFPPFIIMTWREYACNHHHDHDHDQELPELERRRAACHDPCRFHQSLRRLLLTLAGNHLPSNYRQSILFKSNTNFTIQNKVTPHKSSTITNLSTMSQRSPGII